MKTINLDSENDKEIIVTINNSKYKLIKVEEQVVENLFKVGDQFSGLGIYSHWGNCISEVTEMRKYCVYITSFIIKNLNVDIVKTSIDPNNLNSLIKSGKWVKFN